MRPEKLTEYALLASSGAGAVVSVAAQNAIYASAPLTLLAAMGILNRQRLEQQLQNAEARLNKRTDRLAKKITYVGKRISALPSPEAITNFQRATADRTDRAFVRFSRKIEGIQRDVEQRLETIHVPDLGPVYHDICQLQEQIGYFHTSLDNISNHVTRLSAPPRLEVAETQLAQLKTEVMQLRVNLESVSGESRTAVAHLGDTVGHVERRLKQLPVMLDPNLMREEVQQLIHTVADLVPQRDFHNLSTRLQELHQQQADLQRSLEALRQSHLQLTATAPQSPPPSAVLPQPSQAAELPSAGLHTPDTPRSAHASADPWLVDFPLPHGDTPPAASRQALEAAIAQTQDRLLLVWPWSENCELDSALVSQFEQLLARGCQLSIGWCHRDTAQQGRLLRSIHQRWNLASPHLRSLRAALNQLLPLRQAYPQQFRFKILGTDESFLVCDRTFAILSLQSLSTQNTVFQKLDLKLRVNDAAVIDALIRRFDDPSLAPEDDLAYFNRGTTRYDLRDYAGAIDDYTEVLSHQPDHAVALNNRGVVYEELSRSADAEADFTQAIVTGARLFAPYCNRGWLRLEQERFPAAIQDFTRAIQIDSAAAIAYVYRGSALQQLGDFNGAIADYTRAIVCGPSSALPYLYRSAAHQQRGDIPKAIADLELAQQFLQASGDNQLRLTVDRTLQRFRQVAGHQPAACLKTPNA